MTESSDAVEIAPYVLVLHGLARTSRSMRQLANALKRAGYRVLNLDYPSRRSSIQESASQLIQTIREEIPETAPLHLVSHSLGGLVGRELMGQLSQYNWVSAVFLAPPHQGSQVARSLANHPATQAFFRWFYGPAGLQVIEPGPLPLPPCPFGVIAGVNSHALRNPTSWISQSIFPLDAKHDGTVSVEETRLEQMLDLIEIDVDHTWIMNDPKVQECVLHFLTHCQFPHP